MTKRILLTGSTDGIGRLAAARLAAQGHTVCLHGRSQAKLEALQQELLQHNPEAQLHTVCADLSDLTALPALAQAVAVCMPALDVIINNAGVYVSPSRFTPQGLDVRMAVNFLAPVALTRALLPQLRQGQAPLVINLSSAAQSEVSLEVLKGSAEVVEGTAYAQSKLAFTMWTFHAAQIHPEVDWIAVNPGSLLNTRMVQEAFGTHWSPPEKGADLLVKLANWPRPEELNGQYFDNDKGQLGRAHADAYDAGKISALMETTDALLQAHLDA